MKNLDKIAVIAMEGRFPGADNIEEFWDNIEKAKESITFFSDAELREAKIAEDLINNPEYVKAKGTLRDIDLFDAIFFDYSPSEAATTDPQHRLFLEASWNVLEKAGYCADKYLGQIGVFAGMTPSSYLHNDISKNKDADIYQTRIGTEGSFLTTKISYKLNLTGPSININTDATPLFAIEAIAENATNSPT